MKNLKLFQINQKMLKLELNVKLLFASFKIYLISIVAFYTCTLLQNIRQLKTVSTIKLIKTGEGRGKRLKPRMGGHQGVSSCVKIYFLKMVSVIFMFWGISKQKKQSFKRANNACRHLSKKLWIVQSCKMDFHRNIQLQKNSVAK